MKTVKNNFLFSGNWAIQSWPCSD